MTTTFEEDLAFVKSLPPEQKNAILASIKEKQPSLVTHPGPQTMAAETPADLTLYGGAAGGGKTFLAIILALTRHRRTLIIRKEAAQLYAMQDEIEGVLGSRDGFNGQTGIWRLPRTHITDPQDEGIDRQIRFGGLNKPGDAKKYQGAPRDLLIIDEAANITYEEFIYLTVWGRTAEAGQRTRTLLCSNPPVDATGMWMVNVFRPWLDPDHPRPARSGELRWFIVVGDEDIEVEDAGDYEHNGQTFSAQSRTFISAKVDDNPHMIQAGYKQRLQGLPRHLRERMLDGKFLASLEDDAMQVIPSEWVEMAIERGKDPKNDRSQHPMTALGVDPARGGNDEMVMSPRHMYWFAPLIKIQGVEVPTGPLAAARIVMHRRDSCRVYLDAIGVGTSVYDKLRENDIDCEPMIGNGKTDEMSIDGLFKFRNLRALWWWRFREALHPDSGNNVCLPNDQKMKQDLCAFTYTVNDGKIIQVEGKPEAKRRLGRSPDAGDAVVYANSHSSMVSDIRRGSKRFKVKRAMR